MPLGTPFVMAYLQLRAMGNNDETEKKPENVKTKRNRKQEEKNVKKK